VDDEDDFVKTPTERLGACAYLEQPVNIDTLIGTIRKALSKKWTSSWLREHVHKQMNSTPQKST
jgi:DNA-binding NtrC family response regulator